MGIGKLRLTQEELEHWRRYALECTEKFQNNEISMINLTGKDISPYQVNSVLISLGWERYYFKEGQDYDRWIFYQKPHHQNIIMYVNGINFEIVIYHAKDRFSTEFKGSYEEDFNNEYD